MQVNDLFVRFAADWLVIPMIAAVVYMFWRLPAARRSEAAGRALVLLLVALLIAKITSLFYAGDMRPFEMLGLEPGASYIPNPGFPSDHAVLVFCLTIMVWVSTRSKRLAAWMLLLAVTVVSARVMALVHSPLDVTVGALCAGVAGLFVYGRHLFKRT